MANAKVQGADGGGLQGKISFSVVIPVFNVEPYLGQCLDSMLPALRAEDEIILALRSSEDGSITIAEHYAQENGNIRLLRQDGIGLSNARNCAVREAYGTYLIYVDSDDQVDTAQFTHALQRIREDTAAISTAIRCVPDIRKRSALASPCVRRICGNTAQMWSSSVCPGSTARRCGWRTARRRRSSF